LAREVVNEFEIHTFFSEKVKSCSFKIELEDLETEVDEIEFLYSELEFYYLTKK